MISLAEVGLRIDGVDPHIPHHPAHLLPIDKDLIIPPDDAADGPVSPGWMGSMELVNSAHDKQILLGNRFCFGRLPVYTGPVDGEQICLAIDGDSGVLEINEIFSSSRVRGSAQIFFSASPPHS